MAGSVDKSRVEGSGRQRGFLKRLLNHEDGGVAVIYAMALIPLSLLTLTAVDFHRASSVRQALQDSLDAAALAAGRSTATTDAALQETGNRMLLANLEPLTDARLQSATFKLVGGKVVASAEVAVTPIISNLFTQEDLVVGASAEVLRSNKRLEIVLVLDNTGSMQGQKLSTLKTAAKDLVDDLMAAAARSSARDPVKLALVPFSMTVNVGPTYQNANWIDNSARLDLHGELFDNAGNGDAANRFALFQRMKIDWAGCVESRPYPYDVQETEPTASNSPTLFLPYFAPDEPDVDKVYAFRNYDVDNNYLPDGIDQYSGKKTNPDWGNWWRHQGNPSKYGQSGLDLSGGKGPNKGCGLAPVARLTTNASQIKATIQNMTAVGETNIPMGLVWGWHMLSPLKPFADGASYADPDVTKIAILMTDGDNVNGEYDNPNDSKYSGLGYVWQKRLGLNVGSEDYQRAAVMDQRLSELCSNMKAKDIVLYTVRVEVKTGSSALLKSCATTPDHFFDVQQVSQLNAAFDAIAADISRLRLSK